MATLERAIEIAVTAHKGQVDKVGEAYILHPLRVMHRVQSKDEMIVGVLHDVIEDTEWTAESLKQDGFSDEVLHSLGCLTRGDETYEEFIERASRDPVARKVKLADLEDNMDIRRLPAITEKDEKRLAKYLRAWRQLLGRGVK